MHLLKDVPKGGFIPKIQMYLEVFESLLKFVHASTMFYFFLVTPGSCETMKFRVGMQKFLKSEGFEFWHRSCIQKNEMVQWSKPALGRMLASMVGSSTSRASVMRKRFSWQETY